MGSDWSGVLSEADLVLLIGLAALNIYLWLALASEVRVWRKHHSRSPSLWWKQPSLSPARSFIPLLITTLVTGGISVWMLLTLLPII